MADDKQWYNKQPSDKGPAPSGKRPSGKRPAGKSPEGKKKPGILALQGRYRMGGEARPFQISVPFQ